jgi:ATP-dependent protease ClpP protease subunit
MKKIIISGEIGWDVTDTDIRSQLDAAKGGDLDIQIASPGGFVSEGIKIYNLIRDYKRDHPTAQIMATLKGVAASMASYLAVNPAIDMVTAEDNAVFMIHNVWGGAVGDYREMKKSADIFEGLTGILAQAYVNKTKKPMSEVREMMDDETWIFGADIKAAGFVDEMIPATEEKQKSSALAEAQTQFKAMAEKLSQTKTDTQKIAAIIKPEPQPEAQNPAVNSAGKNNTTPEVTMTLHELLSQNPAAKNEYDAQLKAQYEAGKQSMQDRMTAAGKYLAPDGTYPAAIKSLAVDVLNSKKSVEALETTVAAFDAMLESTNSKTAQAETAAAGDTPAQITAVANTGIIQSETELMAEVSAMRKARGLEV